MRATAWVGICCVFLASTTTGCSVHRPETRTQELLIETSPPGAHVWYQDASGQHSLGRGPVTLTREYQVKVREHNPWGWLVPVALAGGTAGSAIWYAGAEGDSDSVLPLISLIFASTYFVMSLWMQIHAVVTDGEVVQTMPHEIKLGGQLDGYTSTSLGYTFPSDQSRVSLLLHPVGTSTGAAGDLAIVILRSADFQRVFPSQYLRYAQDGLGRVEVENRTTLPMDVDLELGVEGWAESTRSGAKLAAGEIRHVPVKVAFLDKVLTNPGPQPLQVVVQARFVHDDIKRTTRKSFPVELLEANAFSWKEPARIASFINGRDPLVEKFTSEVFRQFVVQHPELARRAHPMRNHLLALYTFQTLAEAGIRYKPDPDRPFSGLAKGALDTVQFPQQSLERKVGDCDDLAVLFTSVLEGLDVPTAVVPVEGHVFVMYDTGVREENRAAFPVDEKKTVLMNDSLWVPVETTLLGTAERFEEAWVAGAQAYHGKYKPTREQVVETRAAWAANPPATLAQTGGDAPPVRMTRARGDSRKLMASYAGRVSALAGTGSTPAALLERGEALVKGGLFDEAAEVFAKAVQKRNSFRARYGLAASQAGRGDLLKALVTFQEAAKLASDNKTRFHCQLAIAQCYKVDGNLKKARKHLETALDLNPAVRFDSRYKALVRYLETAESTKAAGEESTPRFFQEILNGL